MKKCVFLLHKKKKFSIKDFFSKCDQIRRKLQIWYHLQKKSLMENFIFCAVSEEVLDKFLLELTQTLIWSSVSDILL